MHRLRWPCLEKLVRGGVAPGWRSVMWEVDLFRITPPADKEILAKSTFNEGICSSTTHSLIIQQIVDVPHIALKAICKIMCIPRFFDREALRMLMKVFHLCWNFVVGSGLEWTGRIFSVQFFYQGFTLQAGPVKQLYIDPVSNVGWSTGGINHQLASLSRLAIFFWGYFFFWNTLVFFSYGLDIMLLICLESIQFRDNRFIHLVKQILSKVLTEIRQTRIIKRTILV